jgi:hypothetical protein
MFFNDVSVVSLTSLLAMLYFSAYCIPRVMLVQPDELVTRTLPKAECH